MKGVILFFIGIALGFLMSKSLPFFTTSEDGKVSESDSINYEKIIAEHRQYFDVIMPDQKSYKLYLNMPKDSVEAILGKPKSNSVSTVGDHLNESWKYGKIGGMVTISFIDGELRHVDDNKTLQ